MTRFDRIFAFYEEAMPDILACARNEWGIPPGSWSDVIDMTPIEVDVWEHLRASQVVMYPQFPVGRFFVDFGNPKAKFAIECDGKNFHLDKEKDARRQEEIEAMGWTVLRLSGRQCVDFTDPEETGLPYARVMVEAVGVRHGLKRKGSRYLSFLREPDWAEVVGPLPEKVEA